MAAPTPLGLTSTWVSLGPGPMLVRVLSGTAVFLSSATAPSSTASGGTTIVAAVGDDGNVVQSTAECWVKGVTSGTTINYLPLPSITASSASSSSGTTPATVAVSQITLLQAIDATLSSLVDGFQALVERIASPAQDASVKAITTKLGTLPAQDASLAALAERLGSPAQDASLAAIANRLGSPAQDGADITGAVMPTGGVGLRGWLSGLYENGATAAGQTSALAELKTIAGATEAASTATNQAAGNTLLGQIVSLLQQTAAETLWTDNTGAYFVRVDNPTGGAPTWKDINGYPSAAPGAGAKPAEDRTAPITDKTAYQAIAAAGTTIAAGDFIDHFVTTDSVTGAIIGQFWLNSSQGVVLVAAPATSNLNALSLLPQGAATLAEQQAIAGLLQQLLTALGTTLSVKDTALEAALGTTTDAATSSGVATTAIGALRAIRDKLLGSIAVTGIFYQTTQPVSSTDGALATLGTTTDAATASGAATTAIGALRAIRDKLLGSIAVTGTFYQTTQPVSSTDGALATLGTTTDAATASGAATTAIGALRAIRDKLLGSVAVTGTFYQMTQPASIADGSSVTLGTKADAAATSASTSGSVVAWLRGILATLTNTLTVTFAKGTAIAYAQPSVGTSPSLIAAASNAFVHREYQNTGTATVYLGDINVTAATGYPVPAGGTYDFTLLSGPLYGIVGSGAGAQTGATLQY